MFLNWLQFFDFALFYSKSAFWFRFYFWQVVWPFVYDNVLYDNWHFLSVVIFWMRNVTFCLSVLLSLVTIVTSCLNHVIFSVSNNTPCLNVGTSCVTIVASCFWVMVNPVRQFLHPVLLFLYSVQQLLDHVWLLLYSVQRVIECWFILCDQWHFLCVQSYFSF